MTRTGIGSISKSTTASHVTLLIHPRWKEENGSGSTRARWRWQGFHPHLFRSKKKKAYFSRRVGVESYRTYDTDNCDGPGWLNILRQCLCDFESTMPPFRKKTAERRKGGSLSIQWPRDGISVWVFSPQPSVVEIWARALLLLVMNVGALDTHGDPKPRPSRGPCHPHYSEGGVLFLSLYVGSRTAPSRSGYIPSLIHHILRSH